MPMGTQNAILARASPYSRNLPYFKLVGSVLARNLPYFKLAQSAIFQVLLSPYRRNLPYFKLVGSVIAYFKLAQSAMPWFCSRLVGAICHAIFQTGWLCGSVLALICHIAAAIFQATEVGGEVWSISY
nr:hypothetical protein Iba_chr06aCG0570 [Ipomoea batatas]